MIRYRSTYVALVIALLLWLLVSVPGQEVQRPHIDAGGAAGPSFALLKSHEHGWPLTYLQRTGHQLTPWRIWQGTGQWRVLNLLADLLLGAVLIVAAGWLFQLWRKQRPRLLQFTLRDLLIATVLVSLAAGYYVAFPAQRRKEVAALERIESNSLEFIRVHRCDWEPGGPTWLRDFVRDKQLATLDHPVAIVLQGDKAICALHAFPSLRKVTVFGPVSDEGRAALARLPNLEAVDLPVAGFWDMHNTTPLSSLRGLKLRHAQVRAESLSGLPALEVLDLSHAKLSGDWPRALGDLPDLRSLLLIETPVSAADLLQLTRCGALRELYLAHSQLTPELRANLARLTQVTDLFIVDDVGKAPQQELSTAFPHVQVTVLPGGRRLPAWGQ